jgi:RecA/RadA recombinase
MRRKWALKSYYYVKSGDSYLIGTENQSSYMASHKDEATKFLSVELALTNADKLIDLGMVALVEIDYVMELANEQEKEAE